MKKKKSGEEIWLQNYKEAEVFYLKERRFPTYKENRKIRQWANSWARKFADTHPQKMQMLLEIGYEMPDKWRLWNIYYHRAEELFRKNGRPLRYTDNKTIYRYFNAWLDNNAKKYPERANQLRIIGVNTRGADNIWERNYKKAKDFYNKYGRFPTRAENILLYEWARRWTKMYIDSEPTKIQKLKDIGYIPTI